MSAPRSSAASTLRSKSFGTASDAARNDHFVALDHMYFPGIGRLRKEGVGYRWLPMPYVNDAKMR